MSADLMTTIAVAALMLAVFFDMIFAASGLRSVLDDTGRRRARQRMARMFRATARFELAVAIVLVKAGLTEQLWTSVVPLIVMSCYLTIMGWSKVPTVPSALLARRVLLVRFITGLRA